MPVTIQELTSLQDLSAFEFRVTKKLERIESVLQQIEASLIRNLGQKEFLSPKEFAFHIGVSPRTVSRWCNDGTIRALQNGYKCSWVIPITELDRFKEEADSLEPNVASAVRVA